MKKRFYYLRDKNNAPVITVCLLVVDGFREIARGVSICSKDDQPNKKIGRKIALARARKAMGIKSNTSVIRKIPFIDGLSDITIGLNFKSVYMPILTKFERRLV